MTTSKTPPPALQKSPLEGVEVWRNPKNKFVVFQLHFTANPNKRDPDYIAQIKAAMPRAQFNQEYNLQWESFAGLPVYQDFDNKRHVLDEYPTPQAGLPMLRGWDFGMHAACIVAQLQGDKLVVFREFTQTGMGADKFSSLVLRECALEFPEWNDARRNWLDFIDPAGESRAPTDAGTCALILDGRGLRCIAGPVGFEERRKAVEYFLLRQNKEGPCFGVYAQTAPVLVRGFNGGYRYPEKALEIEPAKLRPLKDEHSHPHDALQYLAGRIVTMRGVAGVQTTRLSYGWEKR